MHQRSWLAVKPIRKGSPPPATPPMLGRSASARKKQINRKKDKIHKMKNHKLIFTIFSIFFSKMTLASVGIADGPAIEYGFGPLGMIFLIIIFIIILLLEFFFIVGFNEKKGAIEKLIKVYAITLPLLFLKYS